MVEKKLLDSICGIFIFKIQLLDGKSFKRSFYRLILFKTAFFEFGYKYNE